MLQILYKTMQKWGPLCLLLVLMRRGQCSHQVGFVGGVVLLCAHPHQAIVVQENAQGVAGSDQDVDPQVKLVALHQEGLVQVLLHNEVVLRREFLTIPNQRYPGSGNS